MMMMIRLMMIRMMIRLMMIRMMLAAGIQNQIVAERGFVAWTEDGFVVGHLHWELLLLLPRRSRRHGPGVGAGCHCRRGSGSLWGSWTCRRRQRSLLGTRTGGRSRRSGRGRRGRLLLRIRVRLGVPKQVGRASK